MTATILEQLEEIEKTLSTAQGTADTIEVNNVEYFNDNLSAFHEQIDGAIQVVWELKRLYLLMSLNSLGITGVPEEETKDEQ